MKSKPGTKSEIIDRQMDPFFHYLTRKNRYPAKNVKLVQTISIDPKIHGLKCLYQKKTCAIILLNNIIFLSVL